MEQRFPNAKTGSITGADTNAHSFGDIPAGAVTFIAAAANQGTVTILGSSDSAGPVLDANERLTPPGLVQNLNQFKYQFSNAADVLYYVVLR